MLKRQIKRWYFDIFSFMVFQTLIFVRYGPEKFRKRRAIFSDQKCTCPVIKLGTYSTEIVFCGMVLIQNN